MCVFAKATRIHAETKKGLSLSASGLTAEQQRRETDTRNGFVFKHIPDTWHTVVSAFSLCYLFVPVTTQTRFGIASCVKSRQQWWG